MGVTQEDVAAAANVSRALVSLVMRESPQVSDAKREAVLRAAAELGYRRNAHAAQLASRRAMVLGAVLTELKNPLFSQVLGAAEDEAEKRGYGIMPTLGDMDVAHERRSVNRLLGHRLDGLLLLGTSLPADEVRELAQQLPLVTTGRVVSGVDSVEVDGRRGAALAVDHLAGLGHRSIAYIDAGEAAGAADRRAGYLEAMSAAGLVDGVLIEEGESTEAGGVAAAQRLLRLPQPPTAIFAFNDLGATGVLAVARDAGLAVPDQLSVIGFDDSPLSSLQCIDLTSVCQPRTPLAEESIGLLLARIDDPARPSTITRVTPHLVPRSTTGRVTHGSK